MISGLIDKIEHFIPEPLVGVIGEVMGSKRYDILLSVLRDLDESILFKSDIHGVTHVERVSFLGLVIAEKMKLSPEDTKLYLTACVYHDSGRRDEWEDRGHGLRAAEAVGKYVSFEGEDLNIIKAAIDAHDRPDRVMEETIDKYPIRHKDRAIMMAKLLKDADGLDRVRVSDLDPSRLRFEESRKLAGFAEALFWYYK